MDGQTDVHDVSRRPARAASLGHARSRLLMVSSVRCLTQASRFVSSEWWLALWTILTKPVSLALSADANV